MTCWRSTDAQVRKSAPIALDLNGIAKGYGVDRLAETLRDHGIADALVGIDGEMRALGLRPDGEPWTIAVEAPDRERRAPHSILALQDAAVATSGDYRHWVEVQGRRLSHTMDPQPRRAAPGIAGIGHRGGADLRRGRCLGDRADGARVGEGRGTRKKTRARRPVPPAR